MFLCYVTWIAVTSLVFIPKGFKPLAPYRAARPGFITPQMAMPAPQGSQRGQLSPLQGQPPFFVVRVPVVSLRSKTG